MQLARHRRDCVGLAPPPEAGAGTINRNPNVFTRGQSSADEGQRHQGEQHCSSQTPTFPLWITHIYMIKMVSQLCDFCFYHEYLQDVGPDCWA